MSNWCRRHGGDTRAGVADMVATPGYCRRHGGDRRGHWKFHAFKGHSRVTHAISNDGSVSKAGTSRNGRVWTVRALKKGYIDTQPLARHLFATPCLTPRSEGCLPSLVAGKFRRELLDSFKRHSDFNSARGTAYRLSNLDVQSVQIEQSGGPEHAD